VCDEAPVRFRFAANKRSFTSHGPTPRARDLEALAVLTLVAIMTAGDARVG